MNATEFAYWLQGYAEISPDVGAPTPEQWTMIKDHLALVFKKETPVRTVGPVRTMELRPSDIFPLRDHPLTPNFNQWPFGQIPVVTC